MDSQGDMRIDPQRAQTLRDNLAHVLDRVKSVGNGRVVSALFLPRTNPIRLTEADTYDCSLKAQASKRYTSFTPRACVTSALWRELCSRVDRKGCYAA